jgi:oligogalacturonide lyase
MNMETHEWKQAAVLPAGAVLGGISADDQTIMGIRNVAGGKQIFTVDIKTGATKSFFPSDDNLSHDNLNHFECSPTDPGLMLFAHEGNWAQEDRIWTMHADGTGLKLMHARTMPNEIAGHEFFSRDGQWVYYDLQTPESGVFWIGGANVATGEHVRYPILRSEWSVHYYVSWDGKMFLGDGGGPNSVANRDPTTNAHFDPPQNGQWMYLFTPTGEYTTMDVNGEKVKVGKLTTEKLADLSKHNYGNGEPTRVEPNATFTPDDKWLTFRSNMEGATNVYEVEIAKATPDETKRITAEWAAYAAATAPKAGAGATAP